MTHSEMNDLYELYLLGALESEEAAEIDSHLAQGCEDCRAGLREASALLGAVSTLAEFTPPPVHLRDRVLAIAQPSPQKKTGWPWAFGLACAASLALLIWGVTQQSTLERTFQQLEEVSRQRNELRAAVEILSQSDTRTVNFGALQNAPHGRVFLSRNGGVVFLGSRLPELTPGKTFQLWLVPVKGNPQSAGLFTKNAQGISVNVLSQSINPADFAAVAVSVEPGGGSPQPTSKPILIVPLA